MSRVSIFACVIGLALSVLAAAMTIAFTFLLVLPPPQPGRMNVEEMVWALQARPSTVVEAGVRRSPPIGQRSRVVEATLANDLGVASTDVRAVWIGEPTDTGAAERIISVDGREVLITDSGAAVTLRGGPDASVRRETIIPLFIGAVKLEDGRWRWGVPHDAEREAWFWRILAAFLVGGAVLAAPVWFVARWVAAPIERLGRSAMTAGLASEDPLPIAGPREVQATAQAMNGMHNRLVAHAAERVRMVVAVAHDLRTPITALRLRVNSVDEPLRGRMTRDLSRMSEMISEVLEFAAIGSRTPQFSPTEIDEVVRDLVASRRDAGADVTTTTLDTAAVMTDAYLLTRALDNLINNALQHAGAAVLSVRREAGRVEVRIEDAGPGIPDDRLDQVMSPFGTLNESRNRDHGGIGLGLSIVLDIAHALGARFELKNIRPGLAATLSLPLRD
ncbi:MAG: HAMP domain-containing sensor histidine kinase [Actinomycetota bacterium]|nr:HAMP domain-containing sensor histidine kinase [Actinomycetota bacterium]